tara:strand:- start:2874 stop:3689 length:816 start_codon:yes stop_codon:yes gene_type:complete
LEGKRVIANDYNPYIVNLWRVLQDEDLTEQLLDRLQVYTTEIIFRQNEGAWVAKPTKKSPDRRLFVSQPFEEYWYSLRTRLNSHRVVGSLPNLSVEYAALFLVFNRTCFNGLWRESSKSGLNVPIGRRANGDYMTLPNWDDVIEAGEWVRDLDILFVNQSWEIFLDEYVYDPRLRCVVYCDPPYYKKFVGYNSFGFCADTQADLAITLFEVASHTGSDIVVSNSAEADPFYVDSQGWVKSFFDSRTSVSGSSQKDDMSELIAVLRVSPESL